MKTFIDKKRKLLIIEVPLIEPRLSTTGRSLIVGESNGFEKGDAVVDGKIVSVTLKAIIPVK